MTLWVMTHANFHTFVRDPQPLEMLVCRHCGYPDFACECDTEDDDLPAYAGSDPQLYRKEHN